MLFRPRNPNFPTKSELLSVVVTFRGSLSLISHHISHTKLILVVSSAPRILYACLLDYILESRRTASEQDDSPNHYRNTELTDYFDSALL